MKVLAVLPDGNVIDRVRWLAKWNPEIEWDVIGIAPDSAWEPVDWASSFRCLDCDWREVTNRPQEDDDDIGLGGNSHLKYELACQQLRSPLLGYWYHYHKYELLHGLADLDNLIRPKTDYDVLLTWGERGWYNECAIGIARKHGKPVCRLERATFPGMFVADETGLEQGRCDLEKWHRECVGVVLQQQEWLESVSDTRPIVRPWRCGLSHWLSVAPWQAIEAQPRTTIGMASQILDGRPSVFVPLQVPVDTNMVFRAGAVHDNHALLEYVRTKYPEHQIIVKKHPGDGFTCPEKLQSYCDEHGLTLVDMATHAILQVVDRVVSINSQVIIEAWMHNKPVEILGQPAFDLPNEPNKEALLYTLRFAYYIEPWQLQNRISSIEGEPI